MRILYYTVLLYFALNINFSLAQDSTIIETPEYSGVVKASVSVEPKEIPQNLRVTYTIKVSWEGDLDRFEIEKIETPVLQNFEINENSTSNWVGEVNGVKQVIRTFEYILKPNTLGMAYIDGSIVKYKDLKTDKTHRLVTNRLEVEVVDPIIESEHSGLILAFLIILVLVVLAGGVLLLRKKKQAKAAELKAQQDMAIPIEESFLSTLKQNVDLKNQDEIKEFSFLSKLFRKYLSEKYNLATMGLTTPEIASQLSGIALDEKSINSIEEILKTCDVAKFSGSQTEHGSLERVYTLIEGILQQNKFEMNNKSAAELSDSK